MECKARNTSSLRDGSSEVWIQQGDIGPFFCDVDKVYLTRNGAENHLEYISRCIISSIEIEITKLRESQQKLMNKIQKGF